MGTWRFRFQALPTKNGEKSGHTLPASHFRSEMGRKEFRKLKTLLFRSQSVPECTEHFPNEKRLEGGDQNIYKSNILHSKMYSFNRFQHFSKAIPQAIYGKQSFEMCEKCLPEKERERDGESARENEVSVVCVGCNAKYCNLHRTKLSAYVLKIVWYAKPIHYSLRLCFFLCVRIDVSWNFECLICSMYLFDYFNNRLKCVCSKEGSCSFQLPSLEQTLHIKAFVIILHSWVLISIFLFTLTAWAELVAFHHFDRRLNVFSVFDLANESRISHRDKIHGWRCGYENRCTMSELLFLVLLIISLATKTIYQT